MIERGSSDMPATNQEIAPKRRETFSSYQSQTAAVIGNGIDAINTKTTDTVHEKQISTNLSKQTSNNQPSLPSDQVTS